MSQGIPQQQELEAAICTKLATALGETDAKPIAQLRLLVASLGGDACVQLLRETLTIERQGGMLTEDKSRNRTRGGVFFYLARKQLAPTLRQDTLWYEPSVLYMATVVQRASGAPASPGASGSGAGQRDALAS